MLPTLDYANCLASRLEQVAGALGRGVRGIEQWMAHIAGQHMAAFGLATVQASGRFCTGCGGTVQL